jgi:hypothetical protein
MDGRFNAFVTSDMMAVDAIKKNAALNTIVRSNAVNSQLTHGLNRTIKNPIMKYFNTEFSVSKYAGATVAMPSSATAYNPYQAYSTT